MKNEQGASPERVPSVVMKFGGTSVGSAEAIRTAARLVVDHRKQWPRTTVVVSALSGVTNLLLESAERAAAGKNGGEAAAAAEKLRTRHEEVVAALITEPENRRRLQAEIMRLVGQFETLCSAIAVLGEATPRALDAVGSIGERLSAPIFAAVLESMGVSAAAVDAVELIVTDSNFQAAHPDLEATTRKTRSRLGPLLEQGTVPVVTGFIGANPQGVTTTLGRGGSDFSAALLGAALGVSEVWIWTDVDGVMTADPRMVPEARTIRNLSYLELAELAYFGAKVLHPKTVRPVVEAGIGLWIKNTFNPSCAGTRLVEGAPADPKRVVKAVTAIRGQSLITIEGRGMLGVPGVAARAFGAVAATGTSVILISQASSEQSISFAVPHSRAAAVVAALEQAFHAELEDRDIDRICFSEEVVIVTVVGAGMKHTPGVAGRIFSALGREQVNVIAIAQGSSEVAISLVVESADTERAVRALHALTLNG
jgi:aspartokinase/homoserine dehydrogenase 1